MSQMTLHQRLVTVEAEKTTASQPNQRESLSQKTYVTRIRHEVQKLPQLSKILQQRAAVHGENAMKLAGFQYTGTGDAVRCEICRLEVSGWTSEMQPLQIHLERSPHCSFVKNHLSHRSSIQKDKIYESNVYENNTQQLNHSLVEADKLRAIRQRSFSHWEWKNDPFTVRMIVAGFFFCNVHDRTICLYCNLICHEWKLDSDDPIEVHKTLSPQCPYVLSTLINNPAISCTIVAINDPTEHMTTESNATECTTPCHPKYSDLNVRLESFKNWPNQSPSPSSNDLAAAGFFYQNRGNIVTCFNCNGSLKNWSSYDQPIIEHIRWFAQCSYAKQLCDDEFYQKILTAKIEQTVRIGSKNSNNSQMTGISDSSCSFRTDDYPALVPRYVAARMDLPISQDLLDQNYKFAIIKRSWEDQLQLKQNDFADECDLVIACMILKKQIDRIQGNRDNIIVPSIQMRIVRERRQQPDKQEEPIVQLSKQNISENSSRKIDTQSALTSVNSRKPHKDRHPNPEIKFNLSNPCLKCHEVEKQLACIPCGHLSTCIKCSQSLRTCPTCHREIEAYIRVFI